MTWIQSFIRSVSSLWWCFTLPLRPPCFSSTTPSSTARGARGATVNREHAEHVLTPIWMGFAAAEARLEELLEQANTAPVGEQLALGGLRHVSDLEQALGYLRARLKSFSGDGLMTAVDTGRFVHVWPNAYPSTEAPAVAISRWKETRAAAPQKVQPLRREA